MSQYKSKKYPRKRRKQNFNWLPVLAVATGALLVGLAYSAWRGNSNPRIPPEVEGAASLKVDKDKVDLGDVKLGQPVEVSFQLTNVGDEPLRFSKQPEIEVVEGC